MTYFLITYRDFDNRVQRRSFAGSRAYAQGKVRARRDCSTILDTRQITEAEHAAVQAATPKSAGRPIYNMRRERVA